jgi:hypothetical protein
MVRFIVGVFVSVLIFIGTAIYDANKTFGSSWAARGYYFFYREPLARLAETFEQDANIEAVGIMVDGSVGVVFTDYSGVTDEMWAKMNAKYNPLVRALYPNPFLIVCNGWSKIKRTGGGSFCIGSRAYYIAAPRGMEKPRFHLQYWPKGVAEHVECRRSLAGEVNGTCELALDENWTIHYEWWPELARSGG